MTDKPRFDVAVVGLDPQHLRLIEVVFRHIQYNRFDFRLASPGTVDGADILIASVADPDGQAALARARTRMAPRASIGVVGPGDVVATRHAIEIGQLVRQLLPILNRVVEIELLGVRTADASARTAAVARPRVLVIDDSATVRTQLAGAFDRMGLAVDAASSGREALARLTEGEISLAMLDLVLPDGDGLQLARRIRREPRWRELPIVVLSSRRSPIDVVRGAAAGCSAYLAKPVHLSDLQRTVSAQLGRVLRAEALPPQLRLAAAAR